MTGLELEVDELVEVAAIVTDFDLNPVDEGVDVIIKPSQRARENMNEFVTNMHTTSGLINELDAGTTVQDAATTVLDYIKKHVPEAGKAPLGGNSVGTDKAFLQKQMPEIVDYLHYRIIDVSTIKELAKRWLPKAYFNAPEKPAGTGRLGTSSIRFRNSSTTATWRSLRTSPPTRRSKPPALSLAFKASRPLTRLPEVAVASPTWGVSHSSPPYLQLMCHKRSKCFL